MYKNNFVLTILANGSAQKEINGRVYLPFDTEYQIRLKNKHNRRALAEVTIDGVSITGDFRKFVIPARSSITIERFMQGSLDSGPRFKFVSEDHPEVDEPGSSKNGIVSVHFFLEMENIITVYPLVTQPVHSWYYYTYDNSTTGPNIYPGTGTQTCSTYTVECCSRDLVGASIGGSESNQRFGYGYIGPVEITPTILEIRLVSSEDLNKVSRKTRNEYCYICGRKILPEFRFCPGCGSKLSYR